mmetsp:Transcript_33230/g.60662  ORF Transcript_33230/g.60662 Transcript_33230/m.60662 type:complete len:223 (-) Transcript_33230:228-896(-)
MQLVTSPARRTHITSSRRSDFCAHMGSSPAAITITTVIITFIITNPHCRRRRRCFAQCALPSHALRSLRSCRHSARCVALKAGAVLTSCHGSASKSKCSSSPLSHAQNCSSDGPASGPASLATTTVAALLWRTTPTAVAPAVSVATMVAAVVAVSGASLPLPLWLLLLAPPPGLKLRTQLYVLLDESWMLDHVGMPWEVGSVTKLRSPLRPQFTPSSSLLQA